MFEFDTSDQQRRCVRRQREFGLRRARRRPRRNDPFPKRFARTHTPVPSQYKSFSRVRSLLMNANNAPLRGSSCNFSQAADQPVKLFAHVQWLDRHKDFDRCRKYLHRLCPQRPHQLCQFRCTAAAEHRAVNQSYFQIHRGTRRDRRQLHWRKSHGRGRRPVTPALAHSSARKRRVRQTLLPRKGRYRQSTPKILRHQLRASRSGAHTQLSFVTAQGLSESSSAAQSERQTGSSHEQERPYDITVETLPSLRRRFQRSH